MTFGATFPQLLAAVQAGGDWAWGELYRETAPALARFLRARGAPDVDDVVGETFVGVVRRIDSFHGDERAFRAWVFTICRNLAVDAHRARSRRPAEPTESERLVAAGPVGDVEADALGALGRERVAALLVLLTADQRDVVLLRILGELSVDEVAAALGKSASAVKMLQSRGLETLRRAIDQGTVTV